MRHVRTTEHAARPVSEIERLTRAASTESTWIGGKSFIVGGDWNNAELFEALVGRAVGLLGGGHVEVDEIVGDEVVGTLRHSPDILQLMASTTMRWLSSSASAIARVPCSGVDASPVVPQSTIGPASATVISIRGSVGSGKNVQK